MNEIMLQLLSNAEVIENCASEIKDINLFKLTLD